MWKPVVFWNSDVGLARAGIQIGWNQIFLCDIFTKFGIRDSYHLWYVVFPLEALSEQ